MRSAYIILVSFIVLSCGKKDDVNSLRIVGSNTHYNHFSSSEDGNYFLLDKKELRILNAQNPSSLLLKDFGFDSLEIERVVGNSDTLLIQTKTGVVAFNTRTNSSFSGETPRLSICSMIAKAGNYLIVASGSAGCGIAETPALTAYSLADLNDISLSNSVAINSPVDIKTFKNTVFIAEGSGSLKVFSLAEGKLTLKNEYSGAKAKEIRLFPLQKKLLVKTDTGMSQYEILNSTELKLLSSINQTL